METVLLSCPQVARILNISKSLVYRLVAQGEIPSIHIASAVRVHKGDLDAYIERNRNSKQAIDFSELSILGSTNLDEIQMLQRQQVNSR